eukprot:scaffold115575_cov62-Attheya_sp.AAC.1
MWRRQEEEPTAEVQVIPAGSPDPDWGTRSAENFGTDQFLLGDAAVSAANTPSFNQSASNWEDNDASNHTDTEDNDSTLGAFRDSREPGTLYHMAEKTYKMHQKHKSTGVNET